MTIYKLPEMTVVPQPDRPFSFALGSFDGVHIGHRRLLDASLAAAQAVPGCAAAVWSFTSLNKGDPPVPALTTPGEKLRQFAAAGLEYAFFEEFEAVRGMSAREFAHDYLPAQMRCRAAVCGFNFRFGSGGLGDAELLGRILGERNIPLTVVQPVLYKNRIVSSTRIRAAVAEGDMELAAALLGRPFSICFPVLYGNQLGRTIGLPTINQDFPAGHIIPRHGIYACICTVGEDRYEGVANIGVRPSVPGDGHVNCETHIIDYDGFLYGKSIRVEFCRRLRGEEHFPSLDALRAAIERDVAHTRAYFAANPFPKGR
ncbi:MAG: riboflavin biosynthesis protein RibF [Eubacteriales bacterium]